MVKLLQKNSYWYLQYSFKENKETTTFEKYLGKEVPKNILLIKKKYEEEVFNKRFSDKITHVLENFNKKFNNMPTTAKNKYLSQFAIKFTYNSQAIEGSTLTLKDTAFLIEHNINPNKKLDDIELSKIHYSVFLDVLKEKKELSIDLLLNWHRKLFSQTYPDIAGKIRNHDVRILGSKSSFPNSNKLNFDLNEFFSWYNKNKNSIHPLRLAALSHLKFVCIHPFTDGNGRISRLLMNYILFNNNYPMIDIDYSKRKSYYTNLEKSNIQSNDIYFVDYITKKFVHQYTK